MMDNMKQVIDWFEIPVSDMSRAQAFYEAVSGFDQA
jgi:predicted enzyme related to lactoylglutathione lyase